MLTEATVIVKQILIKDNQNSTQGDLCLLTLRTDSLSCLNEESSKIAKQTITHQCHNL